MGEKIDNVISHFMISFIAEWNGKWKGRCKYASD